MMAAVLGILGLLLLGGALWLWRKPRDGREPGAPPKEGRAAAPEPVLADAPPLVPTQWAMPEALAVFQRREEFELPTEARQALLARLRHIPKPPEAAHRLLSEAYVHWATAETLAADILSEPQLAAQVLAAVNAPFYGLAKPVSSVQQAITYLGLDTVRALCVRCLLSDALAPADPRLQPLFDQWWRASAMAGQLCLWLGQRTGVPDPGSMVTVAVLSFVGHLAALSLREPQDTLRDGALDFLQRTQHEQADLGLAAGELGCLLLSEWGMPASIVEEVRQIDRVLTTPPKQLDPQRGMRLALTYYCIRVAEKLASGTWQGLEPAVPEVLRGPEFFHVQTHFMIHPRLRTLAVDFRDPALVAQVARMLA